MVKENRDNEACFADPIAVWRNTDDGMTKLWIVGIFSCAVGNIEDGISIDAISSATSFLLFTLIIYILSRYIVIFRWVIFLIIEK